MNVRLAAQTLSSSVANAIEFLDNSFKLPAFFKDNRKLFDMLNSRNPLGNGYKTPLKLHNKSIWEDIFKTLAQYLLSLKTNATPPQFLSTTQRKTFIIGFVACIKSTICMATRMLSSSTDPLKYLLTYKFSQDHIELLFSCIRSREGWNNNPNCLRMKYALRKMLIRNAITASKNSNCVNFTGCNEIIPLFHKRKHNHPDKFESKTEEETTAQEDSSEMDFMFKNLDQEQHSEFVSNVLYYIAGYIVSPIINKIACPACKSCLVSSSPTDSTKPNEHDCSSARYHEAGRASAFTHFINNSGLQFPSSSVYRTVEYSEHVFKAMVSSKDDNEINNQANLKEKMIIKVNKYFMLDTTAALF